MEASDLNDLIWHLTGKTLHCWTANLYCIYSWCNGLKTVCYIKLFKLMFAKAAKCTEWNELKAMKKIPIHIFLQVQKLFRSGTPPPRYLTLPTVFSEHALTNTYHKLDCRIYIFSTLLLHGTPIYNVTITWRSLRHSISI